jgi:hypothetical protein
MQNEDARISRKMCNSFFAITNLLIHVKTIAKTNMKEITKKLCISIRLRASQIKIEWL